MKLFLLGLSVLVSLNAMAFDVCKFEDTSAFDEAVEAGKIQTVKKSSNHKKFSAIEKKMIHKTVKSDGYNTKVTVAEALLAFGDYYGDDSEPGSNAGVIEYYKVGNYRFALVHYWPGDNEVGAFVEIKANESVEILATISDGWMECK